MNYDLLFLDVDGTRKQEPNQISEVDKEAVARACTAGKKVSIASGRNKNLILNTIHELQLNNYGASYSVALNGAHIIDNHTGDTLHTVPICTNLTYRLFLKAYELDVSCRVYTENHVYFNYNDIQFDRYKKGGCDCRFVDMGSPDLGLAEAPLKFLVTSNDKEKLECFQREMYEATKSSLNAEFTSEYTLEYTSINASKGLGMEYICNLFGKSPLEAVTAEDGENEISEIIQKFFLV